MGDTEEFNTLAFEKKLMQLKDTQESIQGLSSWCLKQRSHHKKIVSSWLNVLKRVKIEQRLVLFYLANDVVQYSKRKNYEFVESWGLNLQKATPLVRDEKVRPKILRIFKIWEQRSVYDDEFLSDLTGLLSAGAVKKTDDDPLDFQPQQLVNKIKQCQVLESDTDQRLAKIHEYPLELSDPEVLCANLKERCLKEDVDKELAEGVACVERYTQALQREIVARETLLALLSSANQYYSTQRGEVKVVAYAYKNFGSRVRALKRKLDELIPTLPNGAPSPPARDEDVPSPGPDEDIDLPPPTDNNDVEDDIAYNIDRTFNTSLAADGSLYNFGLSSFLTSDNPISLFTETNDISSANKIEVINSRPNENQDMNMLNDFLKTLTNDSNPATSENNSVASGTLSQKSQDALPGLDLLTPESTGNPPPPISFYGSIDLSNDEPDQPYRPESAPWTTNNWSVPTAVPPPPAPPIGLNVRFDTPESPPHVPHTTIEPIVYPPPEIVPAVDVDHRGTLPPPPPPPMLPLLGHIEDVDHRMLPLPPLPPPANTPLRHPLHQNQDVDHRNLISLTHQPLPVPRPMKPLNIDQDYRVPTMVPPVMPPPDIVESVDMDLSEDEDQQGMYQQNQETARRPSFNNNKILVGGDNGKLHELNLDRETKEPQSAPVISQMVNPFDAMPPSLQRLSSYSESPENEDSYDEDLRSRGIENERHSPDEEWQNRQRQLMNQRFPSNWSPRTFRPPPQFWPRNGPRPPRWAGPRPQRFW